MASKFLPGMKNVLEVLNQMWDAFAAGPYNALPLTGGTLTGPVISDSKIQAREVSAGTGTISDSAVVGGDAAQPNGLLEALRLGVAGRTGLAFPGFFSFQTVGGQGNLYKDHQRLTVSNYDSGSGTFSNPLLTIDGEGKLYSRLLKTGSSDVSTFRNNISRGTGQGAEILYVGVDNAPAPSVAVLASDGVAGWSAPTAVLYVGRNSETGRSISASGMIMASGADYAEYMVKAAGCAAIVPGQAIGIDAAGQLTDKWDIAIAFAVKSTNPCVVGGDSWAHHLGPRPTEPTRVRATVEQVLVTPALPADKISGVEAISAVYTAVTTAPGETDDEWAARQQAHQAALAAFDIALEAARQSVDRIAFAGQVPVNVRGATPGQYIVPVQDGEGIAGQAFDEADMTLGQYMRALGRVIAIEDDGRARMIVKVA